MANQLNQLNQSFIGFFSLLMVKILTLSTQILKIRHERLRKETIVMVVAEVVDMVEAEVAGAEVVMEVEAMDVAVEAVMAVGVQEGVEVDLLEVVVGLQGVEADLHGVVVVIDVPHHLVGMIIMGMIVGMVAVVMVTGEGIVMTGVTVAGVVVVVAMMPRQDVMLVVGMVTGIVDMVEAGIATREMIKVMVEEVVVEGEFLWKVVFHDQAKTKDKTKKYSEVRSIRLQT